MPDAVEHQSVKVGRRRTLKASLFGTFLQRRMGVVIQCSECEGDAVLTINQTWSVKMALIAAHCFTTSLRHEIVPVVSVIGSPWSLWSSSNI